MGDFNQHIKANTQDILIWRILNQLHENLTERNKIVDKTIVVPRWELTITIRNVQEVDNQGNSTIYIYYRIEHEMFQEPISTFSVGWGENMELAVNRAVFSFLATTMETVFDVFDPNYPRVKTLEVEIDGETYGFDVYISDVLEHTGDGITGKIYEESMWDTIKNELKLYLGKKRFYWIWCEGGKVIGDVQYGNVRINNIDCRNLSKKIKSYMRTVEEDMPLDKYFKLQRYQQYICVLQNKKRYEPYPYTRKEIEDKVAYVFELIKENMEQSYDTLYDRLLGEFKDKNLAIEFIKLLPEICAELKNYDVTFPEKIGIKRQREEKVNWVYKTRITSYDWMREAVYDLDVKQGRGEEVIKKLVKESQLQREIDRRRGEVDIYDFGSNIYMAPSVIEMDDDYKIR